MNTDAHPGLDRDRIRHVIVLMLENRSFDHLLGYLRTDPDYPGAAGRGIPVDPNFPDRNIVQTSPDASNVLGVDPDHSHESVILQMFGTANPPNFDQPTMNGFIASYAARIGDNPAPPEPVDIMRCFPTDQAPVISRLADDFAVLTNWRASVPGETWPNRNYAHAATSHGTVDIELGFYGDPTVFETLADTEARGEVSWGIYHDGVAQVWAFWKLWARWLPRFHGMPTLFENIEQDRLPKYAFVEPNHGIGPGEGNSQHPGNNTTSGASFAGGERLVGRIYNALANKPDVFAKTLLLITYDEHGGFFDHVEPSATTPPDDRRAPNGFDFGLSGVRVPAVAISPLISPRTVDDTLYDHTSIPKTVRTQFATGAEPLNPREHAANDVLGNLPLLRTARQDCVPIELPSPVAVAETTAEFTLNDFEASLLELAGAVRNGLARADSLETLTEPPFEPDPVLSAAAARRVMVPGSPASQAVADVVAMFGQPSSSTTD